MVSSRSSFPPSSLSLIGWRAMKKLVQSAKKLSLKSAKKSTKKSTKKEAATPVMPPGPIMQAVRGEPAEKDDNNDEEDADWPDLYPKKGWSTEAAWCAEGLKSADAFMEHYSSIGIAGIRDEFKTKVDGFKTSKYGDSAFKANPTKNRDNDIMACLDSSRVELEDKRYINASWVFDKARCETKYILTQEPLLSTICDFWQMVYQHQVACIVVFSEKEDGWPPKALPNNPPECETIMNKFWPIKKTNGLKTENLCTKRLNEDPHMAPWGNGPLKPVLDTRLLTCKLKHPHSYYEEKIGCEQTRVETFLTFIRKSQWKASELRSTLNDIAMFAENAHTTNSAEGPIVLMDDYSGTSRAAAFTVVDVMGSLLYKGEKNLTLPQVAKWIRSCRNGAIRTEDDYVFIVRTLFYCIREVFKEEHKEDDEEAKKRSEKYTKQFEKLFGGGEKKK